MFLVSIQCDYYLTFIHIVVAHVWVSEFKYLWSCWSGLVYLDNPLTEKALRYLSCLPKLEKLDGSGTGLKVTPQLPSVVLCCDWYCWQQCYYGHQLGSKLKTAVWDLLGLIYSEKPLDTFDHSRCKTEGWAEQVFFVQFTYSNKKGGVLLVLNIPLFKSIVFFRS